MEIATIKEAELVGIRQSQVSRRKSSINSLSGLNQELTPRAWQRFEEAKYTIALIVDSMTTASENQRQV